MDSTNLAHPLFVHLRIVIITHGGGRNTGKRERERKAKRETERGRRGGGFHGNTFRTLLIMEEKKACRNEGKKEKEKERKEGNSQSVETGETWIWGVKRASKEGGPARTNTVSDSKRKRPPVLVSFGESWGTEMRKGVSPEWD